MSNCFNETTIISKINKLEELIRPYTVGTEGEKSPYTFVTNGTTQFNQAFTDLKSLVAKRQGSVKAYLSTITIAPTPSVSKIPSLAQTPIPTPNVYKVSGYIAPDFISDSSSIEAGFKVEVSGTGLMAKTDTNGYYEINNVPVNTNGYSVNITKQGFLSREIKNVVVNKSD